MHALTRKYNDPQRIDAEFSKLSKFKLDTSRGFPAGIPAFVRAIQHFNLRCSMNPDLQGKSWSMDGILDHIRHILLQNLTVKQRLHDCVVSRTEQVPNHLRDDTNVEYLALQLHRSLEVDETELQ